MLETIMSKPEQKFVFTNRNQFSINQGLYLLNDKTKIFHNWNWPHLFFMKNNLYTFKKGWLNDQKKKKEYSERIKLPF